jgi:hypothetical protein
MSSIDEPTDEECEAIAMLTGYKFNPSFRYQGQRFLIKPIWSQGRAIKNWVEYLHPVTLEVIGEASLVDHFAMLNKERPHDRPNRT